MLNRIIIMTLTLVLLQGIGTAEQWQSSGGPLGGDVRCLARDEADANRVYLGLGSHAGRDEYASGGGVFYSNDVGEHWHRSTLQNVKVAGMASIAGRVWAATYGQGVFTATDPEGEWAQENTALPNLDALCIAGFANRVVVGTTTGPFYADANTAHWFTTDMPMPREIWSIASAPWMPQLMLAATDSGVWRSDTGGRMWSFAGSGLDQMDLRSVAIGEDGRCWAGSFDSGDNAGVYVSADTAQTWTSCAALPAYHAEGVWAILPREGEVLVGTGTPSSGRSYVYRLEDGASSWVQLANYHYRPVRALLDFPYGSDRLLAGFSSCGGVIGSVDGGTTWSPLVSGLDAGNVFAIEVLDPSSGLIAAGLGFSGTVAVTDGGGGGWTRLDSLFPSVFVRGLAVDPDYPQRIHVAAWNGIYRTVDGGGTWEHYSVTSNHVGIDLSPADPSIVYAGAGQGVVISCDGGDSWSEPDSIVGRSITALAVDPRDADHALVATNSRIFETYDTGAHWDTLDIMYCRSVCFHPLAAAWRYVGTAEGVHISRDGGLTYEHFTTGIEGLYVNAILADPGNPEVVWAGTPEGVYTSLDGGQTWACNSNGIVNPDIRALAFHHESRRVFAGSHSGGIHWAYSEATPADEIPPGIGLPHAVSLLVSPVPCRDQVTLSLHRDGSWSRLSGEVRFGLYDLDGRCLRREETRLHDTIVWRIEDVPAGSYAIRVSWPGGETSEPMIVIR